MRTARETYKLVERKRVSLRTKIRELLDRIGERITIYLFHRQVDREIRDAMFHKRDWATILDHHIPRGYRDDFKLIYLGLGYKVFSRHGCYEIQWDKERLK